MDILKEETQMEEVARIENSKGFQRGAEKTQVLVPMNGRDEVIKNRFSHSYEVYTSAKMVALYLAQEHNLKTINDIDYQYCLKQVCLLHDIGHPPFGHDGQGLINKELKSRGLQEGFDDNNNNLIIIENQDLRLRDYVVASTIKYPNKLYESQKELYIPKLNEARIKDLEHYESLGIKLNENKLIQTITCQIMDEADRNSYVCSDLTDFYCLGNSVKLEDLEPIVDFNNPMQFIMAKEMVDAIQSGSKTKIKDYFLNMKMKFNKNHTLNSDGLGFVDKNLFDFRESMSKMEYEFFIKPIRQEDFHLNNMAMLKLIVNKACDGEFCESELYRDKISNAKSNEEKLRAVRDMVGEVSDWYIMKKGKELLQKQEELLNIELPKNKKHIENKHSSKIKIK